jgi:hypothetical protein
MPCILSEAFPSCLNTALRNTNSSTHLSVAVVRVLLGHPGALPGARKLTVTANRAPAHGHVAHSRRREERARVAAVHPALSATYERMRAVVIRRMGYGGRNMSVRLLARAACDPTRKYDGGPARRVGAVQPKRADGRASSWASSRGAVTHTRARAP